MELQNLFSAFKQTCQNEVIEELLAGKSFKLECILSTGQATPAGEWYDQEHAEWVVLLSGAARLLLEDGEAEIELKPGDYINIPAHIRHRVDWTDPDHKTVWLALHYQ